MGVPKHTLRNSTTTETLLSYQARRMAPHFSEVLLLHGEFEIPPGTPGRPVPDLTEYAGQGPLAALLAALEAASTDWVGLLAIDQPEVPPELYAWALEQNHDRQAVVFEDGQGKPQWLCGLYHRNLLAAVREQLREGVRSMKRFWESRELAVLTYPHGDPFCNLNTPEEAERWGWQRIGTIREPH